LKKHLLTLLFSFWIISPGFSQPFLKPSIGLSALPANSTPVCTIPTYSGSFYTSGYSIGDTVNDFRLYKIDGTPVQLSTVITQTNKPVLLVAGSYTCPVFRDRVAELNQMAAFYGSQLNIYIVYVVEAHPKSPYVSPYSGTVWTTSQNQQQGVLYGQPGTYGQRKSIVNTMQTNMTIVPEILIDGPCNEWWSVYGPAPNNAYLIDVNGIVKAKNGWYNKAPDNMWCSIDSLLGTNSGNCTTFTNQGTFTYTYELDTIEYGIAGDILTVHGWLKNLSTSSSVAVDLIKVQKNVPVDWSTAFCTDVCLPPTVDSTRVTIPPADSASLIFYFYTDNVPALGSVKVAMKNTANSSNYLERMFYGSTEVTGIETEGQEVLKVFPNPFANELVIDHSGQYTFAIFDISGKQVFSGSGAGLTMLDAGHLTAGVYFIEVQTGETVECRKVCRE
jgi:hypothetical protein